LALQQRFTFDRVAAFLLGIALVVLSKPAYLLIYGIFVVAERIFVTRSTLRKNKKKTAMLLMLLITGVFIFLLKDIQQFFGEGAEGIREQSQVATGTLGNNPLQNVPGINLLFKYVMALLSPFPWSKAELHVQVPFGGSWLHFGLHVLSATCGVYLFLAVILRWRKLVFVDPSVRSSVIFGLCVSLGVAGGATAFHNYITPSFVFLAPTLLYPFFRIPMTYPLGLILGIEMVVDTLQNFW